MKKRQLQILVLLLIITVITVSAALVRQNTRTRATWQSSVSFKNLTTSHVQRDGRVVHIRISTKDGVVYNTQTRDYAAAEEFIARNPKAINVGKQSTSAVKENEPILPKVFLNNKKLIATTDDSSNAILKNSATKRQHFYYEQTIKDIPVYAGTLAVHVKNADEIYDVSGTLLSDTTTSPVKLNDLQAQNKALAAARKDLAGNATFAINKTQKYIINKKLLGVSNDDTNYNTLAIDIRADRSARPFAVRYFISLTTGDVVYAQTLIFDAMSRTIHTFCNDPQQDFRNCQVKRTEGQAATGDQPVDRAYDYLGLVYNYYKTTHNRDSVDNHGLTLHGTVHTAPPVLDCVNWPNAFWDGVEMVFCDSLILKDVTGHEVTHGVTQYQVPPNSINYINQSGALNEALSDIFGSAIDNDWMIGGIRSMSNPPQFGDPDKLSSQNYRCTTAAHCYTDADYKIDCGGVHYNSGILNKAYYLMTDGGTFNGCTITGVGRQTSASVVYRAYTYLSATSNFRDFYDAVNKACNDLYQASSDTCKQIDNAMKATEIDQESLTTNRSPFCSGGQPQPPSCSSTPPTTPTVGQPTNTPSPTQPGQPTTTPTTTPAATGTPTGILPTSTPAITPGVSLPPTNTPTVTPRSTATPTPIPTNTPTPTPLPKNLALTVQLDPLVANSLKKTSRAATLELYDSSEELVTLGTFTFNYDASKRMYIALVNMDPIPDDNYLLKIKVNKFLKKLFPGIIDTEHMKGTVTLQSIVLRVGDVDNDNAISTKDFTAVANCMNNSSDRNCTNGDLNEDGKTNILDLNIVSESLKRYQGD